MRLGGKMAFVSLFALMGFAQANSGNGSPVDVGGLLDALCGAAKAGQQIGVVQPGTSIASFVDFICSVRQSFENAEKGLALVNNTSSRMRDAFQQGILAFFQFADGQAWDLGLVQSTDRYRFERESKTLGMKVVVSGGDPDLNIRTAKELYDQASGRARSKASGLLQSNDKVEDIPRKLAEKLKGMLDEVSSACSSGSSSDCESKLNSFRSDLSKYIGEANEAVMTFVRTYSEERAKELSRMRDRYLRAKREFEGTKAQVENLINKEGRPLSDPVVADLIKKMKEQQFEYETYLLAYADFAAKVQKEEEVLNRMVLDIASVSGTARRVSEMEAKTAESRRIAQLMAEDGSLRDLAEKTKDAATNLYQEAQNASSTRAAVQLLARGIGELANAQVASIAALQKSLATMAAQNVYTNQQLSEISALLAEQQAAEVQRSASELHIEAAKVIGTAETARERFLEIQDFKKSYGTICDKWWRGKCENLIAADRATQQTAR